MDLIIHHGDCPDGFCAAFIAKKRYPEAELLPMLHGAPPPYDAVAGKDVLVVDFSWRTKEINRDLCERAKSFHIFDHHKTAQAELAGEPYAVFDMDRSGAGLTWDMLFGKNSGKPMCNIFECRCGRDAARPWFVDYVEDRDLWRHVLPKSKETNAYIMTLPHTTEAWDQLSDMDFSMAVDLGAGALAQIRHYVEKAVAQRQMGMLPVGHAPVVAVVNAQYMNCSEVGEALTEFAPVGMTWFERGDGMIQFSLRSNKDRHNTDVSELAKFFGGGGHKNAAGFQLSIPEGRKVIDQTLRRYSIEDILNEDAA